MDRDEMKQIAADIIRCRAQEDRYLQVVEAVEEKSDEIDIRMTANFETTCQQVHDLIGEATVTVIWPEGDPLNIEKAEHGD